MEKEGNRSNVRSCLGSLVISTILVLLFLFSLLFFSPPALSESSWPVVLLTIPIVLVSTLFLVVTMMRKKKGSESEDHESDDLLVQELLLQKEQLQTEEIPLINDLQEAESQSDSSFPSDSETTSGSAAAMDEQFELNAKNNTSLPSSDAETEGFELDQNSNGVLGIYESSDSNNEEYDDDDDDDDLIEIKLPSSHISGLGKDVGQRLESELPDFLPEAMFMQEGLMELLAEINEMNEDENLIEIDISNNNNIYPDLRLKQQMTFSGDHHQYNVVTD